MKAVLFDLDNTLVDFHALKDDCVRAMAGALHDAGIKRDPKSIAEKLWQIYDEYGWEDQTILQKYFENEFGAVDWRAFAHAVVAYRKIKSARLRPYAGVKRTLLKLRERGMRLGVVSDAPRLQAWIRLVELGLDEYFDLVVSFDDTGEKKPSVKPFERALALLKMPACEVLFVGDSASKDIGGARKAGMKTCLALYGSGDSGAAKADCQAESFEDLLSLA
ncbi:hypothetical protein COX86_02560 [Candidatus Micrarchaeota archaeon CG_4_10_14_0_2_um_filter_60_11]|nr:MAG: hypothetical protein AUJ16_00160 [Candidatus Micrarchaeota archaeon CG1_02_60_51]PIN95874.1 MAG: hypothetical protein COU39_03675 [Candidatus Micrarchaeota archaeon CG10_big_fil_rev_8_21_14_0_10_60_32]PIO01688.1 MAG: hypothetical protein COT58_03850 [Candidatus Micrarchaeota archaeon CG09_land_8_20_14_0_10_60_16]PIY91397.1 MAG: hypothetical protein COY71_03375 [Candidatus Micrarchaeota archaeon CG_4_10_14_0_8_um_filter_60_7]PIZ90893.1 MAG: hypothetical protein COX86_02560 [Candidatus Mi